MKSSDETVWLASPHKGVPVEDVTDVYTSRIGGRVIPFRMSDTPYEEHFRCPKCASHDDVTLLAQLYSPLEVWDRIMYVLCCRKCTLAKGAQGTRDGNKPGSGTSFCFAVRSQNFNKQYYTESAEKKKVEEPTEQEANTGFTFAEDDDWGDDAEETTDPFQEKEEVAEAPPAEEEAPMHKEVDHSGTISYPIAEKGVKVPLRGTLFPECVTLDLYEEEVKEKKKKEAEEDMDAVMEKYGEGGKVDFTSVEADTETLEEKYTRTYMAKMEESPSQCVRWCPGGRPLRTFTTPVVVPNCALCGAKRVFEFQLTAQLIYYLMQLNSISEKSNTTLHFSNIHVYACSANCYDGTPYVKEFCFTEDEL